MNSFLMTIVLFTLAGILTAGYTIAGENCINKDGLDVCVQPKGPCRLSQLIPRKTVDLSMDMFLVEVSNVSNRRIRINPADFVAITEAGQAIQVDMPLFESIELKTKLRKADLAPQEQVKGYLFFPSLEGRLRILAYKSQPSFQVQLY